MSDVRHHTMRVDALTERATQAGQAAAMRARRDGLTEDECAQMYELAYAIEIEAGK